MPPLELSVVRSSRLRAAGLALVVSVLSTAVLVLSWRVGVYTAAGREFDALADAESAPPGWANLSTHLFDTLSTTLVAGILGVAVLVAVLRRRWWSALLAVGVVVTANVAGRVLKHDLFTSAVLPDGSVHINSGPSGHTIAAASGAAALLLVVPAVARPAMAVLATLWSAAVGSAAVLSGAHPASDVVGGLFLVLAVVALGCVVTALVEPASAGRRLGRAGRAVLLLLGVLAVAGGIWAAVDVVAVVNAAEADHEGAHHRALVAAMVGIVSLTALTTALQAWVRDVTERAATPVEAAPGTRPARHRH